MKNGLLIFSFAFFLTFSPTRAQEPNFSQVRDFLRTTAPFSSLAPYHHLNWKGRFLAFSSPDTLYVASLNYGCPTCVCCRCTISGANLRAIPMPKRPDGLPIPHFIHHADADGFSLVAAAGAVKVSLLRFAAADPSLSPQKQDSVNYTSAMVMGFSPFRGADDGDSSLIFLGRSGRTGLMKALAQGSSVGQRWGTPRDEIFLSQGNGFFGTASGKIFNLQNDSLHLVTDEIGAPIRAINRLGALGDSGAFAYNLDGSWRVAQPEQGANRLFESFFESKTDANGLSVKIYDGALQVRSRFLADSRTTMEAKSPAQLRDWKKGAPFNYEGQDQVQLVLQIRDPEGNAAAPKIEMVSDGKTIPMLAGFVKADPSLNGCLSSGDSSACVQGETTDLTVQLFSDSVTLSLPARQGIFSAPANCGTVEPRFEGRNIVHKVSQPWGSHSYMRIVVEEDTLIVVHGSSTQLRRKNETPPLRVAAMSGVFHFPVEWSEALAGSGTLRLHDLGGQQIGKWQLPGPATLILPMTDPGVFMLTLKPHLGKTRRIRFVLP